MFFVVQIKNHTAILVITDRIQQPHDCIRIVMYSSDFVRVNTQTVGVTVAAHLNRNNNFLTDCSHSQGQFDHCINQGRLRPPFFYCTIRIATKLRGNP